MTEEDRAAIEEVVAGFFAAFRSGPDSPERLDRLRELFLPTAVIVKTCGSLTAYDVEGFIAPRAALLSGGSLTDFSEWPLEGRIDVYGDVGHWFGGYSKSGVLDGTPTEGQGAKSIQLVRTVDGWRISAAAWDDERQP